MRFLSRSSIGMTISFVIEGRGNGRLRRPFPLPQYLTTLVIPNEVRNLIPKIRFTGKQLFFIQNETNKHVHRITKTSGGQVFRRGF